MGWLGSGWLLDGFSFEWGSGLLLLLGLGLMLAGLVQFIFFVRQ